MTYTEQMQKIWKAYENARMTVQQQPEQSQAGPFRALDDPQVEEDVASKYSLMIYRWR